MAYFREKPRDFASAYQPAALEYCKNLLKNDLQKKEKERKKTIYKMFCLRSS